MEHSPEVNFEHIGLLRLSRKELITVIILLSSVPMVILSFQVSMVMLFDSISAVIGIKLSMDRLELIIKKMLFPTGVYMVL